MANLLSHCLAALALYCLIASFVGFPPLSFATFFAGLLAMLIDLEGSISEGSKVGEKHSVRFLLTCFLSAAFAVVILASCNLISFDDERSILLALAIAPSSHLAIDHIGGRVLPLSSFIGSIIDYPAKGKKTNILQSAGQIKIPLRRNEENDPLLNLYVSVPSLTLIITFVALLPS